MYNEEQYNKCKDCLGYDVVCQYKWIPSNNIDCFYHTLTYELEFQQIANTGLEKMIMTDRTMQDKLKKYGGYESIEQEEK